MFSMLAKLPFWNSSKYVYYKRPFIQKATVVAGRLTSILFMSLATGGHGGTICIQLAVKLVQFACDWRPLRYNSNATGRQSLAIFARASGQYSAKPPVLLKHAVRRIIWIRNEETIKKSEYLRDICTSSGLSIYTKHGPIQSREAVPLTLPL